MGLAGLGLSAAVLVLVPQARAFFTAGTAGHEQPVDLQPLATRSVVYARDGSELFVLHDEENRVPVSLDKVPEGVVRAVLDAEDERFWEHGALDARGLLRAAVENVKSGGILQGGSTITQQLVKTAILTPRQDVNRKVQEAALAIRLEKQMSKKEILERYLNTVYFGNGQYGLEAAAERYFGSSVQDLTLGQGILLASLIRNPVGGDPYSHPDEAVDRRNVVIDHMHELGHITADQVTALKAEPLPTPPAEKPSQGSDYFVEHVKQLLLDDTRLGATQQDRVRAVFKGGLKIYTTLDPDYQHMAEEKVQSIVPDTDGQFTAALVSVEPQTGAVRALVGGVGFDVSKFNLVTDDPGRQTGSSFKPFTLEAALEAGYLVNDSISGSYPCKIPDPDSVEKVWEPKNVEQGFGTMTLTSATVNSVNCAYARLIKLIGPQKVVDVAKRMGITSTLQPYLSLTLGSENVTPIEMASAYATFATDGEHHAPYFVDRVEDSGGKVLIKNENKVDRAISVQNARTINSVLSQVVTQGTGTAAFMSGWSGAQAGKTGSTDDNYNAWFVGYTRDLATAVWMGTPGAVQKPMTNVGGITVYGGTYPAMIWGAYMKAVEAGKAPVKFTPPDPLTTRAPRQLVLSNEIPSTPLSDFTTGAESNGTTGSGEAQSNSTTNTTRNQNGGSLDTQPGNGNQDDSPRTTRTSRPLRPRDLTTVPP